MQRYNNLSIFQNFEIYFFRFTRQFVIFYQKKRARACVYEMFFVILQVKSVCILEKSLKNH